MRQTSLLSFFIVLVNQLFSQSPNIDWQKTYGGSDSEQPYTFTQTQDGGYVIAGFSKAIGGDVTSCNGNKDFWIIKTDQVGNLIWQKSFGGSGFEQAQSIQQTLDGGYIVTGRSNSSDLDVIGNHGDFDFWVIKLNSSGNLIWQKSLGGSNWDEAYSIQVTSDHGCVIAGFTDSNNGDVTINKGGADYWVVKLDSIGNIEWEKTYGGSGDDFASAIYPTKNKGFIVAGMSSSNDGDVTINYGLSDYWLILLDSLGNLVWQKSFGGSNDDLAFSIQETTDFGYIVSGASNSNDSNVTGNHGDFDYWIVNLDSNGYLNWEKSFGGTDYDISRFIRQTQDGGFIVTGTSRSINGDVTGNHGNLDFWMCKLDILGNIIWQKSLGGNLADDAYAIEQTIDGGYAILGPSGSSNGDVLLNYGSSDFWFVKLQPDSTLVTKNLQVESSLPTFKIIPNPTTNVFTLDFVDFTENNSTTYEIIDFQGRIVLHGLIEGLKTTIDVRILSKGVYLLQVGQLTQKLVIE